MRWLVSIVALALALGGWRPAPGAAQVVGRAAIGGAVGLAGGGVITLSVIVARARFQNVYLDSVEDLVHWQSLPLILTPAVGVAFAIAGRDAMVGSIVGSTVGMAIGSAIGAGVGWIVSGSPESPWAGGVIGAGAGMTVGGLFLGIRNWLEEGLGGEPGGTPVRVGVKLRI